MMNSQNDGILERFYDLWSAKSEIEISEDIAAAKRKAIILASIVPDEIVANIKTMLDFGCGYGGVVGSLSKNWTLDWAVGVDYSETAIKVATHSFGSSNLSFYQLRSLTAASIITQLELYIPNGVDCIILADLLEHVPDCHELVKALSMFTKYFLIKLPVESSIVDNYVLPKEYPGSRHSNGHLREFNANDVHNFVRQLGLTPYTETLYAYSLEDALPPIPTEFLSAKRKIYRDVLWLMKLILKIMLPKKIYLRLVGGGGYACVATYDSRLILRP
jgi:SAM-dependent methyltransferase